MSTSGRHIDLRWRIVPVALVILGLAFLIPNVFSQAQNTIEVFTTDSNPYNVTYGDWTARWWRWALSIPNDVNPVGDMTGQYCGQKQEGPVWFLAGTFGGKAERSCTIPEGKAILFSPINAECSYAENTDLKSESELRNCAKSIQDQVTQMEVTVDGTKLEDLPKNRIQSSIFDFELPKENVFGLPAGTSKAVSDGSWVFLKPMSRGNHTIHSVGVAVDPTTTAKGPPFTSDVTYHLTIK